MTAATHSAGVWGSLYFFFFLLNRNLSQTCFGFQAPPLFQPWEASWVFTLYCSFSQLSWWQCCRNLKKETEKKSKKEKENLELGGSETGSDSWNLNQLWNAPKNIWKIGVCYLQYPQNCQLDVWVTHLKGAEIQLIRAKKRENKLPAPTCARTPSSSYRSITPWNPGWHILTQLFRQRLKTQSSDSLL